MESRVKKSLTNAKINLLFYIILLFATFFSRKIFIDSLGNEFVGLTSTLQNILGLFNLAELGVSSAIAYSLYKPLFQENRHQIKELISIFGYIYQKVGYLILSIGILVSFILPFLFKKTPLELYLIYFAYYSYLISSLLTYFLNYKQALLTADQKEYVVTAYYQSANILKILIQIYLLLHYKSPYLWLIIELGFSLLYSIILNKRMKQIYPWLACNIKEGKKYLRYYPEIMKNTKQIFVHKVASVILMNTSSIFIYSFVSLTTVTYYMNYNIIIQKIDILIAQLLNSTSAGIGNLIAEGDKKKIMAIFEELLAVRYFIAGILSLTIYFVINSFINLWLGNSYILSDWVVGLILLTFFLKQTGEITDQFLRAYGLFYDIWAPLTEAGINIVISIIGGALWGLKGVLLGPIISMFFIVHIWKPYFLYTKGFYYPVKYYWTIIVKYLIMLFVIFFIGKKVFIILSDVILLGSFMKFFIISFLLLIIITGVYYILMILFSAGMRQFSSRIFTLIKKR